MEIIEKLYTIDDLDSILTECKFIKTSKKIEYANIPCSFDIETTSTYDANKDKIAFMYCFVFGFNGKVIFGRTWEEVERIFERVSDFFALGSKKRLICYVHNLSFEFQFIKDRFEWIKVFATDDRKPLTALSDLGIEFRCSYLLSGYGLEKVAEHLTRFKIKKLKGDLNYSKIRHSTTPMTEREKKYTLNDALIVMCYISEEMERLGDITKLPLTKTGYVRKYVGDNCLYPRGYSKRNCPERFHFLKLIKPLTISSPQMYSQLKRAFQGGFTHANALYSGCEVHDVASFDFTSSYPSVMIAEKYPMSAPKLVTIKSKEEFYNYLNLYCCIFDIKFYGLRSTCGADNPLSYYKCFDCVGETTDNGRVSHAEEISTTITNVDFRIMEKFYTWDRIRVWNMRVFMRDYLPTPIVKSILKLYQDKTELKDVEGKEVEYLNGKEKLNSCYGMSVTDIVQENITYKNGEWLNEKPNLEKELKKYNDKMNRFLYYPWGVFVTAYARYNLFTGIYECGDDYIYSDTDSIKIKNKDSHMDYINHYNEVTIAKLKKAMRYHGLDESLIAPKTKDGVEKPLGVWDYEGTYKTFKTLGAKRYMVEYEKKGKLVRSLTISGVNKKNAIPWLEKEAKKKHKTIFDLFEDGLNFPPRATGKNVHTYLDYAQKGEITDYLGNVGRYDEKSSVHLEPTGYSLSLSRNYIDYLLGLREED